MLKFTDLNVCRRKFLAGMACSTGTFFLGRLLGGSVAAASTPEKTSQVCVSEKMHPTIDDVRAFRLPFGTEPAIVFRPRRWYLMPTEETDR
jgi:hypothetical protein